MAASRTLPWQGAARFALIGLFAMCGFVLLGAFLPAWELPSFGMWPFIDALGRPEGLAVIALLGVAAIATIALARLELSRRAAVVSAAIAGALPVVLVTASSLNAVATSGWQRYAFAVGILLLPTGALLRLERPAAAPGRSLIGVGAALIIGAALPGFRLPAAMDPALLAGRDVAAAVIDGWRWSVLAAAATAVIASRPRAPGTRTALRAATWTTVLWAPLALMVVRMTVARPGPPPIARPPLQGVAELVYEPALLVLLLLVVAVRGLASAIRD